MISIALIAFALLSVFWFPWFFTVGALILAEGFTPGAALGIGIFIDLLERTSPLSLHALPWGTVTGAVIFVALYLLRRFFSDVLVQKMRAFKPFVILTGFGDQTYS